MSNGRDRPFVHLRVHSDFSFLEGVSNPQALVDAARRQGQPAIALTDTLGLYGALTLSKAASGLGIQPIVGTKLFVRFLKHSGSLILLARDETGYKTICEALRRCLDTASDDAGMLSDGDFKWLRENGAGIVAIAGTGADSIVSSVMESTDSNAHAEGEMLLKLLSAGFKDAFYFEICRNGKFDEAAIARERAALLAAARNRVPLVATAPVHYASPDQFDSHAIAQAVSFDRKASLGVTTEGISVPEKILRHLRSNEEMRALFSDLPAAYDNASEIARRCAFKVSGRNPVLPPFSKDGKSEAELLREISIAGLEARLVPGKPLFATREGYSERLDYELGIIEKMGFPGYFLIVHDFINWSLEHDIPVGLGRGSGAGSLVAYALNITGLDPLQFGLLFERFLNPERVSMPDFDIDFCVEGRKDVIDYVRTKYGADRVAQIVTFMKIKSKSAVRDAARVLSPDEGPYGQGEINSFCNLIPPDPDTPAEPAKLSLAYNIADDLRRRVDNEDRARILFDNARKIEGSLRNSSSHAAGVVIGNVPLTQMLPVGYDKKTGNPVVQFNMKDAETVGLVKFDFLGLETLTIIKRALRFIDKGRDKPLDLDLIPLDDALTMKLFQEGRTDSVFQFESEGMKKAIRDVRPTRIEDLIAICALFRPGPMDNIPLFAQRKREEVETVYPEPAEKTSLFLSETYGILVYQEQVMQVAQVVAGYSLGGADLLRRAMGKKIRSEMETQRALFVEGAVRNGTSEKKAGQLFDTIAKFADYGFNKSHAAAYGVIGYRTAYLKAHYPAEFFSAVMTSEKDKADKDEKLEKLVKEMSKNGIRLLPPDVNRSGAEFEPEKGPDGRIGVRYPLTAIKGIANVDAFLEERRRGPFVSLVDFHTRVGSHFNSGNIENLANCGAFSSLPDGRNRKACLDALKHLAKGRKTLGSQAALFGDDTPVAIPPKIMNQKDWPKTDIAEKEKAAVGFYFDSHPLDVYMDVLREIRSVRSMQNILDHVEAKQFPGFSGVASFGIVSKVMSGHYKSGKPKLDMMITDRTGNHHVGLSFKAYRNSSIENVTRELQNLQGKPIIFTVEINRSDNGRLYVNTPHFRPLESYVAEKRIGSLAKHDGNAVPRFVFDPEKALFGSMAATELEKNEDIREEQTKILEYEKDLEQYATDFVIDRKIENLREMQTLLVGKIEDVLSHLRSEDGTAVPLQAVFAYGARGKWSFRFPEIRHRYLPSAEIVAILQGLGCRDDFPPEALAEIDAQTPGGDRAKKRAA